MIVVLRDRQDHDASQQCDEFRCRYRVAKELFDVGLGDLLAALGDEVRPRQFEAEAVRYPGDLPTQHRGAEDDLFGPRDRQRCPVAQRFSEAPAAQVFHRARRDRLGAGPKHRDMVTALQDEGSDPVMGELERSGEAHRAATNDHDFVRGVVRGVSVWWRHQPTSCLFEPPPKARRVRLMAAVRRVGGRCS